MVRYPSQKRYDEKRPLMSFRIDKELKDKIEHIAAESGRSKSELITNAVFGFEQHFHNLKKTVYEQGFEEGKTKGRDIGYLEGYAHGKQEWVICVNCWRCKKPVEIVPNSRQHDRIREELKGRVGHPECSSF